MVTDEEFIGIIWETLSSLESCPLILTVMAVPSGLTIADVDLMDRSPEKPIFPRPQHDQLLENVGSYL